MAAKCTWNKCIFYISDIQRKLASALSRRLFLDQYPVPVVTAYSMLWYDTYQFTLTSTFTM